MPDIIQRFNTDKESSIFLADSNGRRLKAAAVLLAHLFPVRGVFSANWKSPDETCIDIGHFLVQAISRAREEVLVVANIDAIPISRTVDLHDIMNSQVSGDLSQLVHEIYNKGLLNPEGFFYRLLTIPECRGKIYAILNTCFEYPAQVQALNTLRADGHKCDPVSHNYNNHFPDEHEMDLTMLFVQNPVALTQTVMYAQRLLVHLRSLPLEHPFHTDVQMTLDELLGLFSTK